MFTTEYLILICRT